ncbi:FAD-binding oxidoreductase [Ilumatobacter nonamiensis]|uniref:FAD-binding oxidoreductase n=1 Tax=Ilumatobacter nonamiensis TaxID=467093 RepID=UPI000345B505|nr:FAD-binding oxidoreductase [Ilumatobacter nonamiensis]
MSGGSDTSRELVSELAALLGPEGWLPPDDIADRLVDFRGVFTGSALGLARPASTDEVSVVVRTCAAYGASVVTQGGNTGLSGGAIPVGDRPTVLLTPSRMNAIEEVNTARSTITAQAGVTIQALQEAAASADRLFAPDWGARGTATLGGGIATNAGGINVLRYGSMREQVLGLEVVLADGRVWDGLRALPKDNSGFDLKQLFIASEGTIGIVTRAVLRLHPLPSAHRTAFVALRSLGDLDALFALARARPPGALSAFELIPETGVRQVVDRFDIVRPMSTVADWYVLLRFSGEPGVGDALIDLLATASDDGLIVDGVVADSTPHEDNLWLLRDELTATRSFGGFGVKYDLAIPPDRIERFLTLASAAVAEILADALSYAFGHVGDGNIHFTVLRPDGDDRDLERVAPDITAAIDRIVWDLGGTISAEHGLGRELRSRIVGQKPEIEFELMRTIKAALDPDDRLNPDVMLPDPPAR